MPRTAVLALLAAYVLGAAGWLARSGVVRDRAANGEVELLNVACDPTRELWQELNARFIARHAAETGAKMTVLQSHGGSGSQARAVIDGQKADVVTLALWLDTDAVAKSGKMAPDWETRLPNRSLPFTSTIVMVVRRGNPKDIHDWPDLARDGVGVVTPSPKSSGNGKWSFLALWLSVLERGGSEADAREFVAKVYRNVPILDAAARGATMTFAQKKVGDVHLTWENEAHLEVAESGGALELVYPPVSILAEPHVAVVDQVVDEKGTRGVAEAYLKYLYTDEAQEVIARHHYRPTNPLVQARTAGAFPKLKLVPVTRVAPNWDAVQSRFFAEGGVFDELYAERQRGR